MTWCAVCHTRHATKRDCPGELLATGPERHGWRLKVQLQDRTEVYGVLVAEAGERWRARIVTYPCMLWSMPGGRDTMKFVGDTAPEAEGRAIEFIREHCRARGARPLDDLAAVDSRPVAPERASEPAPAAEETVGRHLSFLVVRFGILKADQRGMTSNLSKGGLFVISETPLLVGSDAKLLLELEGYTVPLVGRVAWSRKKTEQGRPAGMGIQLQNPPLVYARYLRSLGKQAAGDDEQRPGD